MPISASLFRKGKNVLSILITGSIPNGKTIRIDRSLGSDPLEVYSVLATNVPLGIYYDSNLAPDGYRYRVYTVQNGNGNLTLEATFANSLVPNSGVVVLAQTNKPAGDVLIEAIILHVRTRMGQLGISGEMYRADINEVSPKQYEDTKLGQHCLIIIDDAVNLVDYSFTQIQAAINTIMSQITTAKVIMLGKLKSAPYNSANFADGDLSPNKLVATVLS